MLQVRRLATAALLLVAAAAALRSEPAPAPGTPAIAIVGIDGADWRDIDALVAAGRLPAFAAIKKSASLGVMRAEPPLLSPIIWTTIATGRRPEDHGVLDFMVDLPHGGQAPVTGGARRTKALWEIFSDAGRPVLVAGWWATWPADHVAGAIVSDRVAPPHVHLDADDDGLVFPRERRPGVDAVRVRPEAIDYATLNAFVPLTRSEFAAAEAAERESAGRLYRNRFAHARAALAATRTYRAATVALLPATHPAFVAVYFEVVDTIAHLFDADAHRRDAALASAYREVDEAIADIARHLSPDTLVLVLSDHGFYPPSAGIADDPANLAAGAAAWHRPYGIVAATTAGALTGRGPAPAVAPLGDVSPLDIAPTVLAYAGLPVASDMPGRVLRAIAGSRPTTTVASYGEHRRPEQAAAGDPAITAAALERLRSLGYVTGSSATSLARVNLGEILFRKGDTRGAIRELEAVLRADPLEQHAALWLARAYAAAGRPDDAAAVYDRMVQAATGGATIDPEIVLAATDLDLGRGRRAQAADRLARVPASLARAPETLVARGTLADADGNGDEAERLFGSALAARPADLEPLTRSIDTQLRRGRIASASRLAVESARRFPDSPERQALVGETALADRRYADAGRAFRSALRLAPDALSVKVELARTDLMQDDADGALATLGAAASADADVLRGAAYSKKHDWANAVQAYARAVAARPPTADLLNALGNAQLENGRPADAVASFERSLAMNPAQPQIRALLARARQQSRRTPS